MISAIERDKPECVRYLVEWWVNGDYNTTAPYIHGAAIFSDTEVFRELAWLVSILSVKDSLDTVSELTSP